MIIKESRLRSEIRKMLLAESIKDRHGYAVNSISDVKWSSRKIDIPKDLNPFIGSSKAFESWYNDGEMTSTFRVSKNVGMPDEKSFLIKNDIFFPVGSFVIIPELWSKGLEKAVYQVAPPGIYQLSAEQVPGKEKNDSVPVVAIRDPAKPGMPGIENIGIAFLRKVGGPKADLASASNAANDYMLDYKGHNEDAPGADVSQSAARSSVRRRPGESTPRPPARPRDVTLSPEERAKLLGISENKLRLIIREALLREANWANDVDSFLEWADTALTALDVAAAVGAMSIVFTPEALAAQQTISKVGAAVDLAQVFTSLAKDPPNYEAAVVNGISAVVSFFVDKALARAISGGVRVVVTAAQRRALIITLSNAAVDWWVSREKITHTDAAKLKEVIKQNPEPDVGESDGSLEPDVGESDGSPDPVLPTLPKPPSQPRTPSPRLRSPASGCPVSERFAFKYDGWSGSIQDMQSGATVTVDLKTGTLLGDTGWKIESVKSDQEGRPTRVKIIFTDGKCLTVLPLNSFE
jgi:hypothetical protein